MKKQTQLIVLITSFCFIIATCLLSVFAVKNFNINMSGEIEFIAPGIEATISQATLSGVSKKDGSGQMQSFTLTRTMTESQISALSGVKSWSGIKLLFDDESEGKATISFTVTNNSSKSVENIMVNLSTNTNVDSSIQATPSADFCIAPNSSHTFSITLSVSDIKTSTILSGFKFTVEMNIIKPSQVTSVDSYSTKGFSFSLNESAQTATFTKYTPAEATALSSDGIALEIPEVVSNGSGKVYSVTEIASGASNTNVSSLAKDMLTSIKMPKTLTKIGDYAFYQCSKLSGDLVIPSGVTHIGQSAYSGCSNLTGSLTLPQGLTFIGGSTFYNCGFDGDLIIPDGVTSIGQSVFQNCSGFDGKLVLPSGLTNIPNYAFSGCTGLKGNLVLPKLLTNIGYNSFYDCAGFSGDLIIPENVTSIGSCAFKNCSGFDGVLKLSTNLTSIAASAFYNCVGFSGDLIIPETVTNIGASAFYECSGFDGQFELSPNLTDIGASAFYNCSSLKGGITIPQGVTKINRSVFYNCKSLDGTLTLHSNITVISDYAFRFCEGLVGNLILPSALTEIGDSVFLRCEGLTGELLIPDGVEKIGSETFRECVGITKLTIGNSVKTIGSTAFYLCNGIANNVVIPASVTSIGDNAFEFRGKPLSFTILATTPQTFGTNCFDYTNNCPIYVVSTSVDVYKAVANLAEYANRIQAIA